MVQGLQAFNEIGPPSSGAPSLKAQAAKITERKCVKNVNQSYTTIASANLWTLQQKLMQIKNMHTVAIEY